MLPKCSLIKYICINAFDYSAIIVYFTVRKPGTLYETWYYPSYLDVLNLLRFSLRLHLMIVFSVLLENCLQVSC